MDDRIFLGKAEFRKARNLKNSLNFYSSATGQLINWNNSSFFISTLAARQGKIGNILGWFIGYFLCTYLGLPLGLNPLESSWEDLINKFNKKLAGWKGNLLTQAGKVTLLKSYLQSIPTYALTLFRILGKFSNAIDEIQRNFLWSGTEDKKRMALIPWDKICKPKLEGDLSIRSTRSMNKSLLAKQGWRFYHDNKEWSSIWKNKYLYEAPSLANFLSYHIFPSSTIWNVV